MVRFRPTLLALAVVLATGAVYAQAPLAPQTPTQPNTAPVIPPILNLLNRGNPAINYYGIVRPQVQNQQQLQRLQFGLAQTNAEIAATTTATAAGALPITGHVTGFMTQTHYFNTVNVRGR